MVRAHSFPLLALAAVAWLPLPAAAAPRARKLTAEQVKRQIKPALRSGETLAHAVFVGPLGPSPGAALVLVQRKRKGGEARLKGFVLVGKKRLALPVPRTHHPSGIEVAAVLLSDLDGDGVIEPVIMTTYMTGVGPTGAEDQFENYVLDWDGKGFGRVKAAEAKIDALSSGRKVRQALRKHRAVVRRACTRTAGK